MSTAIFTAHPGMNPWDGARQGETDRKLEQRLRQAQQMEALARLAGGVAHDFNNLLTVINGFGALALADLDSGHPVRALVQQMVDAGQRAAARTQQLLCFSRKIVPNPQALDLAQTVTDLANVLRRIVGADSELVLAVEPEIGLVEADSMQVELIVMTLVMNARDAMPRGGRLSVEVRQPALERHADVPPGDYVLLGITDTGCGMSPATLARLGEPFFTTKGDWGTGLGLATTFSIVRQSGGHVAVRSAVGEGTTVEIYLPRIAS